MARIEPRHITSKDGRRFTIRCVEPSEGAALLAFADHVDQTSEYNLTQPGERKMTLEQEREWLQKNLDEPGSLAIGVYDGDAGGRIVGLLNFKANSERRRIAHHGLFGISVHQSERGKGLGAALIQTLLDWAAASPTIEKVCLQVFAPNAHARALYRKMGFKEECVRRNYIKIAPGEYWDDIEMSIDVKPME